MLVRERMTAPVVTVPRDTDYQQAPQLMQDRRLRRLPVIDRERRLLMVLQPATGLDGDGVVGRINGPDFIEARKADQYGLAAFIRDAGPAVAGITALRQHRHPGR